jgi:hypothetical protein
MNGKRFIIHSQEEEEEEEEDRMMIITMNSNKKTITWIYHKKRISQEVIEETKVEMSVCRTVV